MDFLHGLQTFAQQSMAPAKAFFRRVLLSDPERWCSLELGPAPQHLSAAQREAWLTAKLGLLRQVAS